METLGTLIDKLVVVHLKIWHFEEEALRKDVSAEYIVNVRKTIQELNAERYDLITELDELIKDYIEDGKTVKVSKAHKLYKPSK